MYLAALETVEEMLFETRGDQAESDYSRKVRYFVFSVLNTGHIEGSVSKAVI
jgi:hypothetical protein